MGTLALVFVLGLAPMRVFINDVRVDAAEVRGVTLSSVDVRFDENGDVRITAKGYKVQAAGTATPAPPPPPRAGSIGSKRFFVVPQPQLRTGAAQWDVEVYVNQVFVQRFRSREPEPYEITRHIRPGTNTIRFVARKELGPRLSTSPADVFELVVGEGDAKQPTRLFNFKVSAAETIERKSETTLEVVAE
jgi:hypothetical protein